MPQAIHVPEVKAPFITVAPRGASAWRKRRADFVCEAGVPDQVTIQAAISALDEITDPVSGTDKCRGTVHLMGGAYFPTGTIFITPQTTFEGDGWATWLILPDDPADWTGACAIAPKASVAGGGDAGGGYITLRDFQYYGAKNDGVRAAYVAAGKYVHGIGEMATFEGPVPGTSYSFAGDLLVDHVLLNNWPGHCFRMVAGRAWHQQFRNCCLEYAGAGFQALAISHATGALGSGDHIVISDTQFRSSPGSPFYIEGQRAASALTFTVPDHTNDRIYVTGNPGHTLRLGQPIQVDSAGTLPGGLAKLNTYFARPQPTTTDANYATLYRTEAGALLGLAADLVDITDAGSGTHTITASGGTTKNLTMTGCTILGATTAPATFRHLQAASICGNAFGDGGYETPLSLLGVNRSSFANNVGIRNLHIGGRFGSASADLAVVNNHFMTGAGGDDGTIYIRNSNRINLEGNVQAMTGGGKLFLKMYVNTAYETADFVRFRGLVGIDGKDLTPDVDTAAPAHLDIEVYGTAAPAAGTWPVGARVRNSNPAVGQPKGWTCTAQGTPGTWTAEANL